MSPWYSPRSSGLAVPPMPNPERRCSSPPTANTRASCPAVVSKVTCANTRARWRPAAMARIVSYDLRSTTDQLFGLGAGCEGAMDVLLSRVSAAEGWQPLAWPWPRVFAPPASSISPSSIASADPAYPLGAFVSGQWARSPPYPSGRRAVHRRSRARRRTCCCWAAGPTHAPWPRSPPSWAGASPWSNIAPSISRPIAFRHRRN